MPETGRQGKRDRNPGDFGRGDYVFEVKCVKMQQKVGEKTLSVFLLNLDFCVVSMSYKNMLQKCTILWRD